MKLSIPSSRSRILLLAALTMLAAFSTACTFTSAAPSISVAAEPIYVQQQPTYVVAAPPPRVYHSGSWLYYRNDGYYYSSGPTWVRASSVPHHVVTYHNRPTHVVSRPAHVVGHSRTYVRPAPQPTHVRRTVSPTRTYYRR